MQDLMRLSSSEHIQGLKRERDDWNVIYEAYDRSKTEGRELLGGKEGRCGLCPEYKKTIERGGKTYVSCRDCPIVVYTGKTCNFWWKAVDIKIGDMNPEREEGKRIARLTVETLDEVIKGAKNHGLGFSDTGGGLFHRRTQGA